MASLKERQKFMWREKMEMKVNKQDEQVTKKKGGKVNVDLK